jgi:hypothetical protein
VRPEAPTSIVREYEYTHAALCPHDGVRDTPVLPEVNAEAIGLFLAEVAHSHADEFIVMMLDAIPFS